MDPGDIETIARGADGEVYGAARDGRIARLEDETVVVIATIAPLTGEPSAVSVSAIAAVGSSLAVANQLEHCILLVTPSGAIEPFAGIPRLPLARRAGPRDGPPLGLALHAPFALATSGDTLYVLDTPKGARTDPIAIEGGRARTVPLAGVAAKVIAGNTSGSLVVADAGGTRVWSVDPAGRVAPLAGSATHAGANDGGPVGSRFARITALAEGRDRDWLVGDGARLRRVDNGGHLVTLAGSGPGLADGSAGEARFGSIDAIAVRGDGSIFIVDRANHGLRRVDPNGTVRTMRGDAVDSASRLSADEARSLGRSFARAVVAGDDVAASRIVDDFLAEHAARGDVEPDRSLMPLSVASARVGRELAFTWIASGVRPRARVGAFCLWLVRHSDGDLAPGSDAIRVVALLERAIESDALDAATTALDALAVAFGALRADADRRQVAEALRASPIMQRAETLARSGDPIRCELGLRVLEGAADVRHTSLLAAIALDESGLARRAADALAAAWSRDEPSPEVVAELRAGLRFARPLVESFLARWIGKIDPAAVARLRGVLDESG